MTLEPNSPQGDTPPPDDIPQVSEEQAAADLATVLKNEE